MFHFRLSFVLCVDYFFRQFSFHSYIVEFTNLLFYSFSQTFTTQKIFFLNLMLSLVFLFVLFSFLCLNLIVVKGKASC